SLLEVLAKAGSTTGGAGDEVMLIRGHGRTSATLPEAGAADDVVHVNLKDLQGGAGTARNLALSDGDTVYVPRAQVVYVFGQVKNPGSYPVQSDTTVLQVLSLAGGVNPGDTIVVPERFF